MIFNYHNPYETTENSEIIRLREEFKEGIYEIISGLEQLIEMQSNGEISKEGQQELLMEWERLQKEGVFNHELQEMQGMQEMYDLQKEEFKEWDKKYQEESRERKALELYEQQKNDFMKNFGKLY